MVYCSYQNTRKNGMTEHEELLMLRALAAKQAQELEATKRIIAERDEKIRVNFQKKFHLNKIKRIKN